MEAVVHELDDHPGAEEQEEPEQSWPTVPGAMRLGLAPEAHHQATLQEHETGVEQVLVVGVGVGHIEESEEVDKGDEEPEDAFQPDLLTAEISPLHEYPDGHQAPGDDCDEHEDEWVSGQEEGQAHGLRDYDEKPVCKLYDGRCIGHVVGQGVSLALTAKVNGDRVRHEEDGTDDL